MRRMIAISSFAASLLATAACSTPSSQPVGQTTASAPEPTAAPTNPTTASTAPSSDFAVPLIDGNIFHLSEQQGKVVGVTVMASWCETCIPETQAWDRVAGVEKGQALTIVAVSGDPGDTPDEVRAFAAKAKVGRLAWALDPKGEFVSLFHVLSLDTTLIFDRTGRLAYRSDVAAPYSVLLAEVQKLL